MVDQVPSLLIVHQNLNMAKTLATLLAREYNVYIARLASHVDELVESNQIKVVLASQQLPDSTGIALFTELCRLHPRVVRILLIMEDDKDAAFVEEAMTAGIIHRYLTEPLRSAQFIETVRKGFQLYEESSQPDEPEEVPKSIETVAAGEVSPPDDAAQEGERDRELDLQNIPPEQAARNDTEELELVSRNYEATLLHQRERQLALDLVEQKQQQIENMEAIQRGLMNEKERLLGEVERLHKEIAVLTVVRQENARLAEDNTRLKEKSDLVTQQAEKLKAEADSLKSQWELMEQENVRLQDENTLYKVMAEDIEKENAQLRPQVESMAEDVERLRNDSTRLTDENTRLKQENEQFGQELKGVKVQLETWKADSENSRNETALQTERTRLLEHEKGELEQKVQSLGDLLAESRAQSEEFRVQLDKARTQLNSLGMLDGFQMDVKTATPQDIRMNVDPLEIFDRAAEWHTQLSLVQGINKTLEHRVRRYEEEVSRLHEELEGLREEYEGRQARMLRESRGFEEQYKTMREELKTWEAECSTLQREKADLAGKLLWLQTHWNQKQE